MFPSPKELDEQSKIRIDRWIDVESTECKELDDNYALTKKMIRMLHDKEPAYLFTDTHGRLWGRGEDNSFYPFHFEYGKKLIGYRLSKKAAN
jgi:hypothetical protein